ncbi:hypothetical protein [Streptomyces sp. NPDC048527]|uniref:hypothetical protein n=1 Tax=Streptomyces sp. NPDC048527 TaxID=3365568 RepID=UPI0037147DC3
MEVAQHSSLPGIDHWSMYDLPLLNTEILAGRGSLKSLISEMNARLAQLPPVEHISPLAAQRLVVHLGVWGSSIGRHYQDLLPGLRHDPSNGLRALKGPGGLSFRAYFDQLAARTGTGHPNRDAYASLILWNVGGMRALWQGQVLAYIPGVFDDGRIRTYTDNVGEQQILYLFKACETLERASNTVLEPLWTQAAPLARGECEERLMIASHMLAGARRLVVDFPHGDDRGCLTPDQFVDVFRQFAIHWDPDDVPPSGPQDVEFLSRDLMNGMGSAVYHQHIRKIFPGLLAPECARLSTLMERPCSLPHGLLEAAGLTADQLAVMTSRELAGAARDHPSLAACYFYLRASARLSAAHLAMAKKFLFKVTRKRSEQGIVDNAPVSNELGITGLAEMVMGRVHDARKRHPLHVFGRLPAAELSALSRIPPNPDLDSTQTRALLEGPPRSPGMAGAALDPLGAALLE